MSSEPLQFNVEPLKLANAPAAGTDASWQVITSLGLWIPAIDGTTSVGGLEADIDMGIDDVLDDLNFAIFPGMEVRKDKWAVIFNGAYAQLGDEAELSREFRTGRVIEGDVDLEMDMYIADLAVGYRLWDIPLANDMMLSLTPVIGIRYTYLSLEIDPDRVASRSGHEDWWDPYVGGRVNLQINENWAWRTEGTVGGFGVGSDFTWIAQSMFDWRFHHNWELNFGYRAVSWDYDEDEFKWDVIMHGPWIGVSYYWN